MAIKQRPVNKPNPIIEVTVDDSPTPPVPVEAYTNILFHRDLKDKTISVVDHVHSITLDGQHAQSHTTKSSDGDTYGTIVVLRGGVSYVIQLAAPSSQFEAASSGPFRTFLSSWRWE
ncbi:MAG TPA: hypothetical protein VIV12_25715 [Streptosporangiaceae bacterium]